ncbi:MAG: hypothetical protein H8E66_34760 [Planctomycetes bacterium]|nr:hypothetical protein [Planctomycetota bacterium]MBL7038962.1 hypothetical protein [Pirellulaceae bacterium]
MAAGVWAFTSIAEPKSANDKLNIAIIGAGMGSVGDENIVAICDIDENYTGPNFEKYPNALCWSDYRRTVGKPNDIDAVVISTPDHSYAIISIAAIRRVKHV